MFKCTDCGQEYEIKPDFCDCGNNTFEEIVLVKEVKQEPKTEVKVISSKIHNDTVFNNDLNKKSTKSSYSKVDAFSIKGTLATEENLIHLSGIIHKINSCCALTHRENFFDFI